MQHGPGALRRAAGPPGVGQAKPTYVLTLFLDLPSRLLACLRQSLKEVLAVHIINENVLPAVATIHHVIDRAWIFHSHGARHLSRVSESLPQVKPRKPSENYPNYPRPTRGALPAGTNLRFDPFPAVRPHNKKDGYGLYEKHQAPHWHQ